MRAQAIILVSDRLFLAPSQIIARNGTESSTSTLGTLMKVVHPDSANLPNNADDVELQLGVFYGC